MGHVSFWGKGMMIAGGYDQLRAIPVDTTSLWDREVKGRNAGIWPTSYHKEGTV
jgi:hypothetical protein